MMKENLVLNRLKNHEHVLGCIVQGNWPELVEMIGLAGFHFAFIDAEHYAFSMRDCENLVRAAEVRGICAFIRTPYSDPKTVLKYLDLGAAGIIYPDISSKEDAEAAVRYAKYPPQGIRGLSSTRSGDYGFLSKDIYLNKANEETAVLAVIESQEGLDNLEEIFSVEGIDAFLIGTSDLSMSLGVYGQPEHPKVIEAVEHIIKTGKKMGVHVGGYLRSGQSPQDYFNMDADIVLAGINSLLKKALTDFVKSCQ